MINIDDKTRRLSQATIVIGYKQENKAESIEFEIPDYLKEYGKKICFKTKDGKVFSKLFDNTTSNIFRFVFNVSICCAVLNESLSLCIKSSFVAPDGS